MTPEKTTVPVNFDSDSLQALRELLKLIHYDDLASYFRSLLPSVLQPKELDTLIESLLTLDMHKEHGHV